MFALPLIWSIYQKAAAILAPALAIALLTLWIVDTGRLHSAADDNNALRALFDDPVSGFRAQLSRAQANAAQLRSNQQDLIATMAIQDAGIAKLKDAADEAHTRELKALQDGAKAIMDSLSLSARLRAQRPQTGSYAELVGLIREKAQ